MYGFIWLSHNGEPPGRWDLRRYGWKLVGDGSEPVVGEEPVALFDVRARSPDWRARTVHRFGNPRRLVMIGVDCTRERARLIGMGCGDALHGETSPEELAERALRAAEALRHMPRRRRVGPLVLDLFHRDARHGRRWLALHPREFELLWRLADARGRTVSKIELLRDVWRLSHAPETNSLEVHVSRLRAKLMIEGVDGLVQTDPAGGYRLDPAFAVAGERQMKTQLACRRPEAVARM